MDAALLSGMTKLQAGPQFRVMPDRLDPGFVADPSLQTALNSAVEAPNTDDKGGSLKPHAWAVVDLTDDPANPRYAGYNDTEPKAIGSLAKLLPLYGAFELRRNLRVALADYGTRTLEALASAARENLKTVGGTAGQRPLIEKLFVISPGGELEFRVGGTGTRYDDTSLLILHGNQMFPTRRARTTRPNPKPTQKRPRLTRLDDDTVLSAELEDVRAEGRVPAEDQLRLITGWSDNVSAAVITEALGFEYLWALGTRSWLFRSAWEALTSRDAGKAGKAGGLCLTSDYNYGGWKNRPAEVTGSSQAGTARSVATMMTMLAVGELVNQQASATMREMMRKQGLNSTVRYGETSPIGSGMNAAGWTANQPEVPYGSNTLPSPTSDLAVSKIGLVDDPPVASDALIVRTPRALSAGGTKRITAILVGLNSKEENTLVLTEFGTRMAALLTAKHALA
jgi:hypothetical protein